MRHGRHARAGHLLRDVGERVADGRWLEISYRVPLVARKTAIEDTGAGSNGSFAIAAGIPGKAKSGRNMVPAHRHNATGNAWVTKKKCSKRGLWKGGGLHARFETCSSILRIGWRCLNVPAKPKVQCHTGNDSEIVLDEKPRAPTVGVTGDRRVLREGGGQPHHEISKGRNGNGLSADGILDVGPIESKHAIVVQKSLLNIFVERFVSAECDRMAAVTPADDVA